MSLSVNQRLLGRVLVLVCVLYGLFYVLYQQPEWTSSWRPASFGRAQLILDHLANSSDTSSTSVRAHESMLEKLWHPDQIGHEVHSSDHNAWKDHNGAALRKLLGCMATDTCTEHQTKVVIAEHNDYRQAFLDRTPGGEKIFARSVLTTFDSLGVTYLFSLGTDHLAFYYSLIPDLIRAVVMHHEDVEWCWHQGADDDCLKTSLNPLGTPIHHMFTPEFFGSNGYTPFGHEWTLTPEHYPGTPDTYIGYSIEKECMAKQIPAHADRPRQVWVLAKWAHYFTSGNYPLNRDTFVKAGEALNVEFVSAFQVEDGDQVDNLPPGITNLGHGHMLSKADFEDAIVNTLAIVGLKDPILSPTPWYGLCWSLPFLNPFTIRDDGSIDSQHDPARRIGEPHVYNYSPHDDDMFIDLLRKAIEPHERYIPPAMTQPQMNSRILGWLERDWKGLVEERMQTDEFKMDFGGKDFLL